MLRSKGYRLSNTDAKKFLQFSSIRITSSVRREEKSFGRREVHRGSSMKVWYRRKARACVIPKKRDTRTETVDTGGFRDTLKQEFTRPVSNVNNGWDAVINPRGSSIVGYLGLRVTRSAPFRGWALHSAGRILSKIYQANSGKIYRWKRGGVTQWHP